MRHALALSLLAACGREQDDTGPFDGGTASPDLVLRDENNYDFVASLALEKAPAAEGADVVVDWSGIDTDYRGRPFDPADVDQLTIAAIELDNEALVAAIDSNGLNQEDIIRYYQGFPDNQTSMTFGELSILGQPFDHEVEFVPGYSPSWLLTLWKEDARGVLEILSSQLVEPAPGAPAVAPWTNGTATLTFDPDLGAPPLRTVADAAAWSLDWSELTVDVNGAPYDPLLGDTLRIAHVAQSDPADVEADLLRLDLVADGTWFLEVFGLRTVEDLSAATALDGSPFPGFTADGTWLVGLECTQLSCFSPAPLALAVVEVE
jgi:hypothetical protein